MKKTSIKDIRHELGLNQTNFAKLVGVSSKSQVSEIESGKYRPSLKVALEIERLSGGRINASDLNDEVRASRAVILDGLDHDEIHSSGQSGKSMGQCDALSREDSDALGAAA